MFNNVSVLPFSICKLTTSQNALGHITDPERLGYTQSCEIIKAVYTGDFCRAKIASSFKHVRNPCDIAATNRTKNRTWFTRAI